MGRPGYGHPMTDDLRTYGSPLRYVDGTSLTSRRSMGWCADDPQRTRRDRARHHARPGRGAAACPGDARGRVRD